VARAKELLGCESDEITVYLSKNVYKNALAVGIPNTGMTGLPIAIALGATVGKSAYMLEVLRDATPESVAYAKDYMLRVPAQIHINYEAPSILYIHAEVRKGEQMAQATIMDEHTHFVTEVSPKSSPKGKDFNSEEKHPSLSGVPDDACVMGCSQGGAGVGLSLRRVYDFATSVDTSELAFLLEGAQMNTAAAETSFAEQYGHGLGRLLRANTLTATPEMERLFGNTLFTKIISYTCGACDARMSGAMVQVMSNSGSGNQGISCSIPVYLYAKENNCDEERTLRALALSNLTVIYIKQSLGRLSALCGCVVAATGSAAGITYLMGGNYEEITYAIKNMIANISGMICDGAKPGCALKVTSGVATAIFSAYLAMQHSYADSTEGIVEDDIDRTIRNLTRIGHDGMKVTDDLILDIMTHKQ
jgi:L-cysteine desulfidase